jgi:adenylylsulfate kinase
MGWAIWVTGLPGSGKTTLARAAARALAARGMPVTVLELDEIRRALTPDPTDTDAERDIVYRALAYMAKVVTEAGGRVIVDATAHRRAWRDLARGTVPVFAEVQLVCPLEVCRAREESRPRGHAPVGIYAGSGRPGATVPGVDVPYEAALHPELTLDTDRYDIATQIDGVVNLARRLERLASLHRAWPKRRLPCA